MDTAAETSPQPVVTGPRPGSVWCWITDMVGLASESCYPRPNVEYKLCCKFFESDDSSSGKRAGLYNSSPQARELVETESYVFTPDEPPQLSRQNQRVFRVLNASYCTEHTAGTPDMFIYEIDASDNVTIIRQFNPGWSLGNLLRGRTHGYFVPPRLAPPKTPYLTENDGGALQDDVITMKSFVIHQPPEMSGRYTSVGVNTINNPNDSTTKAVIFTNKEKTESVIFDVTTQTWHSFMYDGKDTGVLSNEPIDVSNFEWLGEATRRGFTWSEIEPPEIVRTFTPNSHPDDDKNMGGARRRRRSSKRNRRRRQYRRWRHPTKRRRW